MQRGWMIRGSCLQPHHAAELTHSYCNRWHPKESPKECALLAIPPYDGQESLPSRRWSLSSADNGWRQCSCFIPTGAKLTSTNLKGFKVILLKCSVIQHEPSEERRSGNGETLRDSWWLAYNLIMQVTPSYYICWHPMKQPKDRLYLLFYPSM